MFYFPNREQAIRIQRTLEKVYKGVNGQYYYGDAAWNYLKNKTSVDLLGILKKLAQENAPKN
jgi:hypothetical protein